MNNFPRITFENDAPLVANPARADAQGEPAIGGISRPAMRVAIVLVADLAILGSGAIATAVVNRQGTVPGLASEPLLYLIVAILMAHCGTAGIWWARAQGPSHAKTLAAVLCGAALWALITRLLDDARTDPAPAAAWAAGLGTQLALTAIGALLVQALLERTPFTRGQRFSIRFLLIWTAVVAVLLGAGRRAAESYGWTNLNATDWTFVWQLQCVGVANATLAVALMIACRLCRDWPIRTFAAAGIIGGMALVMPLVMFAVFGVPGRPTYTDLVWLWGGEGLTLAATLLPLEIACQRR